MAKKTKKNSRRGNATTNGTGSGTSVHKKKTATVVKGLVTEPCRERGSSSERRAIVVLGMHRSGTSALTRVLNLCGATLPKKLMPPSANNNELGFWEPARIYQIHERLFSEIGSSWDDVADVATSFYDSALAHQFQHELRELVREEFGASPLFVIKDPRICRLVPLWLEVLERVPAEVSFVLPIRNPLEVALSLQARDGMPINQGLLLWLRHFLSAERDSRGFKRSFCRFEHLLDDWRQVIERVSRELNIAFPRMSARAGAEIDAFLEDSARHQRKGDEEVLARRDVLGWVKTAYRWALAASMGGADGVPPAPDILDELNEQLTAAESAFGPMVAGERVKSAAAVQRAAGFETEIRSLRTTLGTKTAETENLQADLCAIQNRLAQSSEETSRLARQLAFRDEELTTLLEWSKTVVRWAAETITGNMPASTQLGNVLQSLEVASAEQVPLLASEGIELAERDALRRQLGIAEQALTEMTRERDRVLAEGAAVRQELATTATARDAALAEIAVVRSRVSAGEVELTEARSQYQELATRLQAVTAECGQALKERESALIERERMQSEIAAATQRYRQAVRAGAETAREQAAARAEVSRLESTLAEAERTHNEELAALAAERAEALTQQNLADTKRQQLQIDYAKLLTLREAAEDRYQQLRNESETLQQELRESLQEQTEKRAVVEEEAVRLRGVQAERELVGAELAQVLELLNLREKQINTLDAERLKIAESLTKIRLERDTLSGRIETLAAKLEKSQRETVNLNQLVERLSAETKRYAGEVDALARDLHLKQTATAERDALVVIQRRELERIKSSRAWKLVQPFRAVAGVGAVAGGKKRPGSKSL